MTRPLSNLEYDMPESTAGIGKILDDWGEETWRSVLASMPHMYKINVLAGVLRTRRRSIPIRFNAETWMVPRAWVRDYLRESLAR